MKSNLEKLGRLALSWKRNKRSKGEERIIGDWILAGMAREDFRELEDEERTRVIKASMEEFKVLAEQAIRLLDSKGPPKVEKSQVERLTRPNPSHSLEKEMADLSDPSSSVCCGRSARLPTADEQDLKLYRSEMSHRFWRK